MTSYEVEAAGGMRWRRRPSSSSSVASKTAEAQTAKKNSVRKVAAQILTQVILEQPAFYKGKRNLWKNHNDKKSSFFKRCTLQHTTKELLYMAAPFSDLFFLFPKWDISGVTKRRGTIENLIGSKEACPKSSFEDWQFDIRGLFIYWN